MSVRRFPTLDDTWRLIERVTPTWIDESINGQDCYVFSRIGGAKPTDIWTVQYIPVAKFWGAP